MNGCKRVLSIILISVILTGCSQRSSEIMLIESEPSMKQEHMFLSVYGYKADVRNLIAIEKILNQFMEQNPDIIVTYEGVKGIDYWKALERRAEANVLDDVFMVDHDRVMDMADKGRLADLSSLSTIENYQDRMKEQFIREDGSVYFLPICISLYGLYINYSLLEAHGQKVKTTLMIKLPVLLLPVPEKLLFLQQHLPSTRLPVNGVLIRDSAL